MGTGAVGAKPIDGVVEEESGTPEGGGVEGVAFERFFAHVTLGWKKLSG
jgi:hypothetical protein